MKANTKQKTLQKTVRHHAKKILVPHKENQYRPHLIRARGIIAVLLIAVLMQVAYSFTTTGKVNVLGQASNMKVGDLLAQTNKEREANNIADLTMNDLLSQAANLKAQDMFEAQYWAHTSPSGVQPWKWFGDVGYQYSYAGENLAKNYPTTQATVDAWMDSETHRENILNPHYTEVGFAIVDGTLENEHTTLIVAMYGAPAEAAAQTAGLTSGGAFLVSSVSSDTSGPFGYFVAAARSLSPVSLVILALLSTVALVGAITHHYRQKLPKKLRTSWRAHHGMYTFFGMIALGILVIIASGTGSI